MASTGKYLNQADYNSTTLSDLVGKGLTIPGQSFVENRYPGKLEELYSYNGNANTLYTIKTEKETYTGYFSSRFDNTDKLIGKNFKSSITDAEFITRFLTSAKGTRFLTRQFLLQGYQPFDETKLYNPASPIIAAAEPGMWGLLDRPTRHIDTSNIIGGVIDAVRLGTVTSTISSVANIITGNETEETISPPRSSVASGASSGIGLSTLTSMLGATSKVDVVMSPIARDSVKGLLRGGTATDAYISKRYARIVQSGQSSLLGRLTNSAINYVASKTAIGSLVNPSQPWDALYRADEKTYDFMLSSKDLFFPKQSNEETGIVDGILGSLGFGKFKSFNGESVPQRFRAALTDENTIFNGSRYLDLAGVDNLLKNKYDIIYYNKDKTGKSSTGAYYSLSYRINSNDYKLNINDGTEYDLNTNASTQETLRYTDVVTRKSSTQDEISDVLLVYKNYIDAQNEVNTDVLRVKADKSENETQRQLVNYPADDTNSDKYTTINVSKENKKFFTEEPEKYNKEGKLEELTNKTINNVNFYNNKGISDKISDLFSNDKLLEPTEKLYTFKKVSEKINNNSDVYTIDLNKEKALYPLQFDTFSDGKTGIGHAELAEFNEDYDTYLDRYETYEAYAKSNSDTKYPSIKNRQNFGNISYNIFNHDNKSNYINDLEPIQEDKFAEKYANINSGYGPDFVKFYFYDIVNKIYIPFTAIITNLTDNTSAQWTAIDYVNRADKLYHYNGFTRTINLGFKVVVGSVKELLPTWKRLNYLVGLTRPANYTLQSAGGGIVPPMIQFTLGDLFKNHFIIFNSINITIRPDVSWETVPEELLSKWRFGLKDAIQLKDYDKIKVAQFPKEAEVACAFNVLEKDRPMVGHAIWGDAPTKLEQVELEQTETYKNSEYLPAERIWRETDVEKKTSYHTEISGNKVNGVVDTEKIVVHPGKDFSNRLVYPVNDEVEVVRDNVSIKSNEIDYNLDDYESLGDNINNSTPQDAITQKARVLNKDIKLNKNTKLIDQYKLTY